MALIKCMECRREISSLATTCPGCGAPVPKPAAETTSPIANRPKEIDAFGKFLLWAAKHPAKALLFFVLVLAIIGSILPSSNKSSSSDGSSATPLAPSDSSTTTVDDWRTEDNHTMAFIMMKDYVKNRLKAPSTAEFPDGWMDDVSSQVHYLGNQRYRVTSYVDAQNSFGAKIRTRFVGEIEQTSEDNWRLISLDLLE